MAAKEIKYNIQAREKVLKGVNILADAVKVTRFAIQNAASVAGLLLTTEVMVAKKPKKEEAAPMPPGGGADMY